MPEAITPPVDGGQAPTNGTPQTGTPTIDGQALVSQTPPAEHDRIITELRKENAAARKRLEAFEKAQADAEAAKLTELDKATRRATELEQERDQVIAKMRDRLARSAIQLAATKLNIIDPEVATALISNEIEYNEDGDPTNVDQLLRKLIERKPYLVQAPAPTPRLPATNPGRGGTTPAPTSRAQAPLSMELLQSLSPAEYARRAPEIRRFLAQISKP